MIRNPLVDTPETLYASSSLDTFQRGEEISYTTCCSITRANRKNISNNKCNARNENYNNEVLFCLLCLCNCSKIAQEYNNTHPKTIKEIQKTSIKPSFCPSLESIDQLITSCSSVGPLL